MLKVFRISKTKNAQLNSIQTHYTCLVLVTELMLNVPLNRKWSFSLQLMTLHARSFRPPYNKILLYACTSLQIKRILGNGVTEVRITAMLLDTEISNYRLNMKQNKK